jgi:hypothetical protein
MPNAADYDLFVSHPRKPLDDEYSVRLDVPIVDMG